MFSGLLSVWCPTLRDIVLTCAVEAYISTVWHPGSLAPGLIEVAITLGF